MQLLSLQGAAPACKLRMNYDCGSWLCMLILDMGQAAADMTGTLARLPLEHGGCGACCEPCIAARTKSLQQRPADTVACVSALVMRCCLACQRLMLALRLGNLCRVLRSQWQLQQPPPHLGCMNTAKVLRATPQEAWPCAPCT